MSDELRWLQGPWRGRVAISARPRGGDWLEDEIKSWSHRGITTVVSLLTPEEERELDLSEEAAIAREQGMMFLSLPVPDREVPQSESEVTAALVRLRLRLADGGDALIHCRQGIGRAGLLASCLLIFAGQSPEEAMRKVGEARGIEIPETEEQRRWVENYRVTVVEGFPGRP